MKFTYKDKKTAAVPGILISANSSGSGKTTAACAVIKALKNRNMNVCSFKCGPDYIDPMFHRKILGVPSKNLDAFFCEDETLKAVYADGAKGFDIAVTEGVMGYYDGLSMSTSKASSYDIARKLGIPVLLVIDAKGAALTINAVIKGICDYKEDSGIKGVLLNNISESTFDRLKPVIENEVNVPVVGFLPHIEECGFKSRHLGLVFDEGNDIYAKIAGLGEAAERYIDIDKIIDIAKSSGKIEYIEPLCKEIGSGIKIGVAYDDAFCFYYEDNIGLLEKMGCTIEYFSPINDKKLPEGISGLILGGGYPELHLSELSQNKTMLEDIKMRIEDGLPCLAECGGFMYLHREIEDKDGNIFPMVDVVDGKAYFTGKSVRFGYCTLTASRESYALSEGREIKAHEFHYFDSTSCGASFAAKKPSGTRKWECMELYKNVICGFPHLYYLSNPEFAAGFVKKCVEMS